MRRCQMKLKPQPAAAAALLLVFAFVLTRNPPGGWFSKAASGRPPVAPGDSAAEGATEPAGSGSSPDNSAQIWRRSSEIRSADHVSAPDDAAVRIGFVQADSEGRNLRVSLQRTPAEGEVLEVDKIEVRMEVLETQDQEFPERMEGVEFRWDTQNRDFAGSAAPRLLVESRKPIPFVRVTLIYDGRQLERRLFAARELNK